MRNTPKKLIANLFYKAPHHFMVTLFLLMVLLPFSAFALNLQEAKSQLLVGESVTGYLGVVKSGAGVAALVSDVNAKRKTSYQKIAKRNGTSLSAVERLAAKKAIEKTARGQMIQTSPGGAWIRK